MSWAQLVKAGLSTSRRKCQCSSVISVLSVASFDLLSTGLAGEIDIRKQRRRYALLDRATCMSWTISSKSSRHDGRTAIMQSAEGLAETPRPAAIALRSTKATDNLGAPSPCLASPSKLTSCTGRELGDKRLNSQTRTPAWIDTLIRLQHWYFRLGLDNAASSGEHFSQDNSSFPNQEQEVKLNNI